MPRTIGKLKKDKRSKSKKQTDFLAHFSECASVSLACRKSKNSRSNIYQLLNDDDKFKELYDEYCAEALGGVGG